MAQHHETRSRAGDSPGTPSDSAVLYGAVAEGVSGELRYYDIQSGVGGSRAEGVSGEQSYHVYSGVHMGLA